MDTTSKESTANGKFIMDGKETDGVNAVSVKKSEANRSDYFTIKYYNDKEISICKPLLPMKIALFVWFAAASSVMPFFVVFLKNRGLTVHDISIMFMISPILQFMATSALGVLADRIGRPKPILVLNLVSCSAIILILVAMPDARIPQCQVNGIDLECTNTNSTHLSILRECGDSLSEKNLTSVGSYFSECVVANSSSTIDFNNTTTTTSYCYSPEGLATSEDETVCLVSCAEARQVCEGIDDSGRFAMILVYGTLQLVFITGYVNVFRFIDVTVVALVDEHNSDYGKERFWGVLGAIVGPTVSSLIVKLTTDQEADYTNYAAAFYMFAALSIFCAGVVYKVDVRSFGAGKNMQKKALSLLKRPDYLIFVFILLVQGSTWGFFINFKGWYLEDLGIDPYQIGLLDTINAIYGLPILLLSKIVIEKIGVCWIFVIAFLARTVQCLGYAFLVAPWMAFPIELSAVFGYHLFWVAAMNFSNSLAVPGIISSVNSLAGSIHFTIGRSTGSIVGGLIMSAYNGKTAFQVLGGINLAFGLSYALFLLKKKYSSVNK